MVRKNTQQKRKWNKNCSIKHIIVKRVSDLFAPYDVEGTGIDLYNVLFLCRHFRQHEAMRILKTWVNGWATSHRMHAGTKLFCLFGCQDQLDSMNHYIHCPFWLFLLSKTTLDSKPSPSSCPLTRLGLVDQSEDSLKSVACSFAAYHAVKRSLTHNF